MSTTAICYEIREKRLVEVEKGIMSECKLYQESSVLYINFRQTALIVSSVSRRRAMIRNKTGGQSFKDI